MSLHWKMHTSFPFTRVFVLGVILFFLGLASMIISIIAFVTQSWGHYVGTGMWGGATIVASGLTAVFVSRLKSLASVKTFCICSVTAMFTSLTMLILSAGGLTLNSGFYNRIDPLEYNKRTSNLIHASLLVISVFCLSGNVLAVIVCCKYLFFEHHEKPKHRRHHHRNLPEGAVRTSCTLRGGAAVTSSLRSTNSRTPLQSSDHNNSRRHSDNADVNRVQIEYRRSHRRTVSDQIHNSSHHSHSRRQRHSHQEFILGSNNSNLLSPCSVRYHPDRRSGSNFNRSCSQGREVRGDSKERERLNIAPQRQGTSRPSGQPHLSARLSRSPISGSPKVRLPTEFNEEELPPYEAVETANNALVGSVSDSGDESDTENSSSTDGHSYDAANYGEEGAEIVPMVELWHGNRDDSTRQLGTTEFTQSSLEPQLVSSAHRGHTNQHSAVQQQRHVMPSLDNHHLSSRNEASVTSVAGSMVMRKDTNQSNMPLLSYVNTHSSDQSGEYERLLSVSPEVCAITGESPEPESVEHVPHVVAENFYENGPCYENIRCVGRSSDETVLNHLSKSSSSNLAEACTNEDLCTTNEASPKSSTLARKVPVHVISNSSHVAEASPQSPRSSFGSTLSAFRPVIGTAALSPHSIRSPAAQSPLSIHLNNNVSSPSNNDLDALQKSQHTYSNQSTCQGASSSVSSPTKQYIEQGAIPKAVKQRNTSFQSNKTHSNFSWKNIPLPLSYNHSESASNELEKKLPSKTMPFADSNSETARFLKNSTHAQASESSKLSSCVCPPSQNSSSSSVPLSLPQSLAATSALKVSVSQSLVLPVSSLGAATEAIMSVSAETKLNRSADTQAPHSSVSTVAMQNIAPSSVREVSTQVNSGVTSRWHSHRMGGNQSLLQSRREELQNSRRAMDVSARAGRPSSMPSTASSFMASNGTSVITTDRLERNRSSVSPHGSASADPSHTLSLSSYLVNSTAQGQSHQPLALRQNHLLQHYPLQPQQPRLGVQLHQRRQQQHQLQQNIESQQQHQQQLQQQQQPPQQQQGNQQNPAGQQGRNGRPLFSVLL